jgi:hypothetical protein
LSIEKRGKKKAKNPDLVNPAGKKQTQGGGKWDSAETVPEKSAGFGKLSGKTPIVPINGRHGKKTLRWHATSAC